VLISDASTLAAGYIICNEDHGKLRVLQYGGRRFNAHERNYSVSELELASLLYAIESNSQFFLGKQFTILTDHLSNTFIRIRLYRWSLRLQNYSFEIKHLPGAKMPADFLSRSIDVRDLTAETLEDDSHLVFTVDAPTVKPVIRRRRRRHRAAMITLPDEVTRDFDSR